MILVTGGAGFIGSNLIRRLNDTNEYNILVCDVLGADEKYLNLVDLKFTDYIRAGDLLDSSVVRDVKTIYHLGACSSTTEKNLDYLIKNNFEYTKRLCDLALGHGCKFVYASSAATYGDGSKGMSDSVSDLSIYQPLNPYGYSKQLFDMYAQQTGILSFITGLKYFNVFGPRENHKGDMRSVINKAVQEIRETGKLKLFKSNTDDFEDGEQSRDFLYVKDAINMTLYLGENKSSGIYNIGSGKSQTWNYLAKCIFDALGQEPSIEYIDMPNSLVNKYQNYTRADITKIQRAGYKKQVTHLNLAVDEYVKYLTGE